MRKRPNALKRIAATSQRKATTTATKMVYQTLFAGNVNNGKKK